MRSEDLLKKAHRAFREVMDGPMMPPETILDRDARMKRAVNAAIQVVVADLRAMLYPELFPGYDPEHVYWDGKDVPTPEQLLRVKQLESALYSKETAFAAAGGRGVELADEIDAIREELEELPPQFNPDEHAPFQWSSDTIEWVAEWAEALNQHLQA